MADWTASNIPDQSGRTAIVTGANSGIGFEAAKELARHGAKVILACRSEERAEDAIARIRAEVPEADLTFMELDLASLQSVRAFAEAFKGRFDQLDLLINNAGIMAIPRRETKDGFEMQLGVNHLSHFALTGLLLDRLTETEGARIVNVSSMAHKMGNVRFDDLQRERRYNKWEAYGQSKLANLVFTYELERRLREADKALVVAACHPGWSSTNLQEAGPKMEGASLKLKLSSLGNKLLAQSAEMGALPTLYAATAEGVRSGDYIGPDGAMEWRGYPQKVRSNAASQSVDDGKKLWQVSERLPDVRYGLVDEQGAEAAS